ncbi:MAG: hypothetical protein AB7N76_02865 [Planctomycetota bacterium]
MTRGLPSAPEGWLTPRLLRRALVRSGVLALLTSAPAALTDLPWQAVLGLPLLGLVSVPASPVEARWRAGRQPGFRDTLVAAAGTLAALATLLGSGLYTVVLWQTGDPAAALQATTVGHGKTLVEVLVALGAPSSLVLAVASLGDPPEWAERHEATIAAWALCPALLAALAALREGLGLAMALLGVIAIWMLALVALCAGAACVRLFFLGADRLEWRLWPVPDRADARACASAASSTR